MIRLVALDGGEGQTPGIKERFDGHSQRGPPRVHRSARQLEGPDRLQVARPEHPQVLPGHRRARRRGGLHEPGPGHGGRCWAASTRWTPRSCRSSGMFVDWASDGNAFKAEIYFVGIRDFPNFRFGGRLDEVQDPQTGLIVTLRTFGEYALRVVDAPKLILNLVGTVDVTNNDAITAWVTQQLLKVTRTTVTTQLMSGAWPILGLSMHSPEIEVAAMQAANHELADYGISITRLGQPRHQPGRRRQRAAEEAGRRHRLQPAGRRLPAGGPGRGAAGRGPGHGPGRRRGEPDLLRRRHGHGQPDDAGARPGPGRAAAAARPGFAGGGQGYAQQPAAQQPPPAGPGAAAARRRRPRR